MILFVAGLISGGLYFFVNSSAGQSFLPTNRRDGFNRQIQSNQAAGGILNNLQIRGNFQGREFRGGLASQRALAGIVQNVAVIALITFMVVSVQKVIPKIRRKRSLDTA